MVLKQERERRTAQQQELAAGLAEVCLDTRLIELDCIRGHDSFLVDMDAFRPVIWDFMA